MTRTFGNILRNSIISLVIVVVLVGIIGVFISKSFTFSIFLMMGSTRPLLIPVFLSSIAFELIKKQVKSDSSIGYLLFRMVLLNFCIQLGLVIWAMGSMVSYYGSFGNFTLEAFGKFYLEREFLSYQILIGLISIVIPLVDFVKGKNQRFIMD